jgi:hypothetical protein
MDTFQFMNQNGRTFFSTRMFPDPVDYPVTQGALFDSGKNSPGFWCPALYDKNGQFAWIPQDYCQRNFRPIKCDRDDWCNRKTPEVVKIMKRF